MCQNIYNIALSVAFVGAGNCFQWLLTSCGRFVSEFHPSSVPSNRPEQERLLVQHSYWRPCGASPWPSVTGRWGSKCHSAGVFDKNILASSWQFTERRLTQSKKGPTSDVFWNGIRWSITLPFCHFKPFGGREKLSTMACFVFSSTWSSKRASGARCSEKYHKWRWNA